MHARVAVQASPNNPLVRTDAAIKIQRVYRTRKGIVYHGEPVLLQSEQLNQAKTKTLVLHETQYPRVQRVREIIWRLMEDTESSRCASGIAAFIMGTICASIACFIAQTDPDLDVKKSTWDALEIFSTCVFSAEYLIRLCVCSVYKPSSSHTIATVPAFICAPQNLVDLGAIAPFYLELAMQASGSGSSQAGIFRVLRTLRLLRLLRVFKLGRHFEGLNLMMTALASSVSALLLLVFMLSMGVTMAASTVYYAEKMHCPADADFNLAAARTGLTALDVRARYVEACSHGLPYPEVAGVCCDLEYNVAFHFETILEGFWWAIVTMATVGYGDKVPVTLLGKFVGSVSMLCGILLIALPVAIVGSKFQDAYEKTRFENRDKSEVEVKAPTPVQNKFRTLWNLLVKQEEVAKDIAEVVDLKRQIAFHLYSEMCDVLDTSPVLAEARLRRHERPDLRSSRDKPDKEPGTLIGTVGEELTDFATPVLETRAWPDSQEAWAAPSRAPT